MEYFVDTKRKQWTLIITQQHFKWNWKIFLKKIKLHSVKKTEITVQMFFVSKHRKQQTLKSMTLNIFHSSIRSPTQTLMRTTKFVSLSITYKTTITDWKTLKNTERTERPSSDLRFLQNCISTQKISAQLNYLLKTLGLTIFFFTRHVSLNN